MIPDPSVYVCKSGPYRRDIHANDLETANLIFAVLVPPVAALVFVGIMMVEANCTLITRLVFFGTEL